MYGLGPGRWPHPASMAPRGRGTAVLAGDFPCLIPIPDSGVRSVGGETRIDPISYKALKAEKERSLAGPQPAPA